MGNTSPASKGSELLFQGLRLKILGWLVVRVDRQRLVDPLERLVRLLQLVRGDPRPVGREVVDGGVCIRRFGEFRVGVLVLAVIKLVIDVALHDPQDIEDRKSVV